jgi:hypothetical protein
LTYGGRLEALFTVPSATTVTATNNAYAGQSVSLTAASYTPTSFCTHLAARLNAVAPPATGAWAVTLSTGSSGTGKVTIAGNSDFTLAFTTATVGTILGFVGADTTGSLSSPATGTQNARGLWLPDAPIDLEGDPDCAPKVTDSRATESPTGGVITLGGNTKYVHKGLRWSHVTRARMIERHATTTYASLEQWLNDTQFGAGHTWFSRGSAFQVYWDNAGTDRILGYDLNSGTGPTYGWKLSPAIGSFEPQKVQSGWVGMYSYTFPRLVSVG